MEIYRDSTNIEVALNVSVVPSAITIERFYSSVSATATNGMVTIPYSVTRTDGNFEIAYTFTEESITYTKRDRHIVVTPLFTWGDITSYDEKFVNMTEAQAIRLEQLVRSVFRTLTGQKFGYERDSIVFTGNDGDVVRMPKRLVVGNTMNVIESVLPGYYTIANDGWTLRATSTETWLEELDRKTMNIVGCRYPAFRADKDYTLDGYFGYVSVPEDVKMAAMILAGDYGCDESTWRDRYITNISSADWRIQFNSSAFRGTGNVIVDQIIDKYHLNNMVAI